MGSSLSLSRRQVEFGTIRNFAPNKEQTRGLDSENTEEEEEEEFCSISAGRKTNVYSNRNAWTWQ